MFDSVILTTDQEGRECWFSHTKDQVAVKFKGRCTKLSRLLIPTGMPELL